MVNKKQKFKRIGRHKTAHGMVYQCTNPECEHRFVIFFEDQLDYKNEYGCPECIRRAIRGY